MPDPTPAEVAALVITDAHRAAAWALMEALRDAKALPADLDVFTGWEAREIIARALAVAERKGATPAPAPAPGPETREQVVTLKPWTVPWRGMTTRGPDCRALAMITGLWRVFGGDSEEPIAEGRVDRSKTMEATLAAAQEAADAYLLANAEALGVRFADSPALRAPVDGGAGTKETNHG